MKQMREYDGKVKDMRRKKATSEGKHKCVDKKNGLKFEK